MNAFQRGKTGLKSIYVPTRHGGLIQRATGTKVPNIVRAMKKMVTELADKQRWTISDALQQNRRWTPPGAEADKKLTLADVYTFYVSNAIDQLEAILDAKNLSEQLAGWEKWITENREKGVRTPEVYYQQVTTLIPEGGVFLLPDLTRAKVLTWLAGLGTEERPVSSGTKRKYLYALRSFIRYLIDMGILATDPTLGLKAPKKNKARERWETIANDKRIVDSASEQYQPLFAMVKGVGCDLSSAIARAQKGDFNLAARKVNVRGTKTSRRSVHQADIEAWAIPYLEKHLKTFVGTHTKVFAHLSRHGAAQHHARCCDALGIEDYNLKDARHSVGVRMRLRNESFEKIAAQLGTSVFQAVTVYTKYKPEDAAKAAEAVR